MKTVGPNDLIPHHGFACAPRNVEYMAKVYTVCFFKSSDVHLPLFPQLDLSKHIVDGRLLLSVVRQLIFDDSSLILS